MFMKVIGWFKMIPMLGTWKLMAIGCGATALIVGSTAFMAGVRWEKADRYDEAKATITAIEAQATQSLEALTERWQNAASEAQIRIEDWNLQNAVDTELFNELLRGQSEIRSKFDELESDILVTTDFGTCKLSPDAIRLLREAADTANNRRAGD